MVIKICMYCFLLYNAWTDLRKKQIYIWCILVFGILGVIINIKTPYSMILGTSVGLSIILVSKITKGSIGIGDGWVLLVTGI